MEPSAIHTRNGQSATGKNNRLRELKAYAILLEERLTNTEVSTLVDDESLDKLRTKVDDLYTYCQKPKHNAGSDEELERLGTTIWNLSTRILRHAEGPTAVSGQRKTGVCSRVFAFFLLDAAQYSDKAARDDVVRLMRLALKASKSAVDASELDIANHVLQKAAEYVGRLTDKNYTLSDLEEARDIKGLEAEYFILRTALSWKQNRLDVAEHMYNKGHLTDNPVEPRYAEKLADVLYEIGGDMSRKKDFRIAVKWLGRAQDVINSQAIEQLSPEALELRTAIMQAHVVALLHLDTKEDLKTAQNLIDFVQSEMGNTMVVLVLRLDVLNKVPPEIFDSNAYAAVLGQMITSLKQLDVEMDPVNKKVNEPAFRLINHHIGKLHSRSPELGCAVMDQFILALAKTKHDGWMERLVTKRVWMAASRPDSITSIEAVQATLSCLKNPLTAEATVAVQTLLWKSLESVYTQGLFGVVERWCQLALNPIFVNSGPSNRAKIERKYLLCAIARNDLDGARSIHHSMADETKQDPRTWYLMYKVAIRNGDQELATTCLEGISKISNSLEYLYACCVDATSCPNKEFATESLTALLEANKHSSSSSLHLPALLRCTIRLYVKNYEKSNGEEQKISIAEKVCDAFDQVVSEVQRDVRDANGNKLFDIKELDWFGRNSYNLGLQNIDNWDVSHTIRILTACIKIMSHYPPDVSSEVALDLKQRALFSNFIIATALLARARAEDNVESQLQDYLEMRKHVAAYDSELPAQLPALVGEARNDMLQKLATLLAFDFEGAVRLKEWGYLVEIVRKTAECKNVRTLQGMADCLLRSDAPVKVTYTTLRQIINQIYELESLDGIKLSRYMRCLFQVTLPFEDELALGLADEYIDLIQDAKRNTIPLPPEELEWLATTAFNHAVDFYFAKQDELCQTWAFKAFALAHLYEDGGALEKMLHERYGTLKFDTAE